MLAGSSIRKKHLLFVGSCVAPFAMASTSYALPKVEQSHRVLHFGVDGTSFYTLGRWTPADPKDRPAYPTETEIDCSKAAMTCTEGTAEYYSGHPHINLSYATVIKWDRNSLVAVDSSGICLEKTLLVSFPNKTLIANYTLKQLDQEKKAACKTLGVERPEAAVFVIKGSAEWTDDLPN